MGLGRRATKLNDDGAWVFNRMADVYDARPAYPESLIAKLADLAGPPGARVVDVGAGVGHVALPLAGRGLDVVAVEPARAMLQRLRAGARRQDVPVRAHHARAESMPIEDASADLVVISDALHFMDAEQTGYEVARILAPGGALAIVTCTLTDTPYMNAVRQAVHDAVPRRPRAVRNASVQIAAMADVTLLGKQCFHDQTPVPPEQLERILRSISFVGPAMNPERFAAFRARVQEIPLPPHWARTFTLRAGRRAGTAW